LWDYGLRRCARNQARDGRKKAILLLAPFRYHSCSIRAEKGNEVPAGHHAWEGD